MSCISLKPVLLIPTPANIPNPPADLRSTVEEDEFITEHAPATTTL